jgi:hypothetical protein
VGSYRSVKLPIPGLAQSVRGLGFINLTAAADGPTRRIPLLAQAGTVTVPHMALTVAQDLLGAQSLTRTEDSLKIADRPVPLASDGMLLLNWHGTLEQTYRRYAIGHVPQSFTQLEKQEQPVLDPAIFQNKIVFIAGTAAGSAVKKLLDEGLDQDKETEADALGDLFGSDTTSAYVGLLTRLRKMKGDDKAFFKTHPNFSTRINAVQEVIRTKGLQSNGVLLPDRFCRRGRII